MFHKPNKRFSRILVAALVSMTLGQTLASSASAAPPPDDLVLLPGFEVDFGNAPFVGANPLGFGVLDWNLANGEIRPHLTGKLYINSALGATARMRMRYFDVHDNWLATKYGGEVTATSNGLHTWSVNLDKYANDLIYRVEVATQQEVGSNWQNIAQNNYYMGSSSKGADGLRLTGTDIDFGLGAFLYGAPVGFGAMAWDLSNGTIRPHTTGTLYLNDALGVTARMKMRYYDVHDNWLATKYGGEVTATSNGLHTWSVDLDKYASNLIYRVDVSTQVKVGAVWSTVRTQTTTI